jgi:acyl-CoA synthetase (AMP-forming)/AMP-acid ligase II
VEKEALTHSTSAARLDARALERTHPLTLFGLDALVAGAARTRPKLRAFQDHVETRREPLAYADVDHAVGAFLGRLREFSLPRGDRALLLAAPRSETLIALTALIAAGVEPVLAPATLSEDALAAAARAVSATAIFAPARSGDADIEARLRAVAARTPGLRLIGSLGGGQIDGDRISGAVDFSLETLRGDGPRAQLDEGWTPGARSMIGAVDFDGETRFLSQGALLGYSLDLVRKARHGGPTPLVMLSAPSNFGALVAGPLAALLSGAPLHFLSPFDGERFLVLLDTLGPARLLAPRAVLPDLARAGLLTNGALASCIALSNAKAAPVDFVPPPDGCPLLDMIVDGATLHMAPIEATSYLPRALVA